MIMVTSVCIIGCGRTARAMAAYLSDRGVAVSMWGRDAGRVAKLCAEGISVTGCCEGIYHPTPVANLGEAIGGSKYVFVMTTSGGHRPIAEALRGKLGQEQRILIFNGNWGAYEFYSILGEEAGEKNAVIAETGAMLFLADYVPGSLHIKKIKDHISLASIPKEQTQAVIEELSPLFPQFVAEKNVLCTSINNSNPVIHAPVTLFNLGRIENGEDFLFYRDAATRSVIGYIEKIDKERCDVSRAIGAEPVSCLEIINSFWPDQYDNLYDAIKCNAAYMSGKGPTTLDHRYINEDIPFGMAAVSALGKRYHVSTPYIDAMLMCFDGLIGGLAAEVPDFSARDIRELC